MMACFFRTRACEHYTSTINEVFCHLFIAMSFKRVLDAFKALSQMISDDLIDTTAASLIGAVSSVRTHVFGVQSYALPCFCKVLSPLSRTVPLCPCAQDGWTPLHFAASSRYAELVKALLRKGAAKNAITTVRTGSPTSQHALHFYLHSLHGLSCVSSSRTDERLHVAAAVLSRCPVLQDGKTPLQLAEENVDEEDEEEDKGKTMVTMRELLRSDVVQPAPPAPAPAASEAATAGELPLDAGAVARGEVTQTSLALVRRCTDALSPARQLSRGGFGAVYHGFDERSGLVFAAKVRRRRRRPRVARACACRVSTGAHTGPRDLPTTHSVSLRTYVRPLLFVLCPQVLDISAPWGQEAAAMRSAASAMEREVQVRNRLRSCADSATPGLALSLCCGTARREGSTDTRSLASPLTATRTADPLPLSPPEHRPRHRLRA